MCPALPQLPILGRMEVIASDLAVQQQYATIADAPDAGQLTALATPRAEPGKEDILLKIASAFEAASRRRTPPPAFGPLPAASRGPAP